MFKKSLQILVLCALISLAAIVAFAVLHLRGFEDTLREAQGEFAAGNYAQVLVLMNQAAPSPSVRNDPEMREQLWRLRFAANSRLGNPKGALQDVNNLLANGHADDIELQLDQIRLLAQAGEGELARKRAKQFLEKHDEHSRGLELAGEACQTAYQPLLGELRERIDSHLSKNSRDAARPILLAYLYLPDGPQMVREARKLERLFAGEPQLLAAWPEIWSNAKRVRARIQEGLGFYQRSLDLGGEPVAAFRAVATALEQSGRLDDLMLACEIQRRKFSHDYVTESGVLAAWARIQTGLPTAAVATAERWLPTDSIPEQAAAGTLSPAYEQLLLARAFAAWQLNRTEPIKRTGIAINHLRAANLYPRLAGNLLFVTRQLRNKGSDPTRIERGLAVLIRAALREPPPHNRPDFVATFAPIQIDQLLARGAVEEEVLAALKAWRRGRPEAIEPRLRAAEYLLSVSRTPAALAALDDAQKLAPADPRIFPLRLRIAREHFRQTDQDGIHLLDQCRRTQRPLPETSDAIGYVLCAEAALAVNDPRASIVALACARNAISAFPKASVPRQYELRALLQQNRFEEASITAMRTLQAIAPDATTLALAIAARRALGEPIRELVRMAMPTVAPTQELQTELLRIALADAPSTAHRFLQPKQAAKDAAVADSPADATLQQALAIRAYVASGELDRARQLLASAPPVTVLTAAEDAGSIALPLTEQTSTDPATITNNQLKALAKALEEQQRAREAMQMREAQGQLALAFAEWLQARAATVADADLLRSSQSLRERLQLDLGPQAALLEVATALAKTHPDTAYDLLGTAIPAAAPENRSGKLFELAGELALAHNNTVRAQGYWLAAIAFGDGRHVAERLTRLLLLTGDEQRAARVYEMVPDPTDGALAARFGKVALASTLMAEALQRQPAELLNHAALATFGQPTMVDWQAPLTVETQTMRLELLAALNDPALARLGLVRAETLLRADPRQKTHYLLVARASTDAGLPQVAGRIHGELFATGYMNPVLAREVARGGQHPSYSTSRELLLKVMAATTAGTTAGSELTVAYGMEQIAKGFAEGGFPEMARKTRLAQWLSLPHLQPCDADDLELIATGHDKRDACYVLDQILQGPYPCDRAAVLGTFYRLANALVLEEPAQRPFLVMLASGHLAQDGALGAVVHFLLDNPIADVAVDAQDLLTGHLAMVARAKDDARLLPETVEALIEQNGLAGTAREIDQMLAQFPTALPMWTLRTRLQTQLMQDGQAIEQMRGVLRHASDPDSQLTFLALAAASRNLTPSDFEAADKLPAERIESPAGKYAQALLSLRQGRADEAVKLFEGAAPQPDGRHLFELALAHLESSAEQGSERAKAALEKLQAHYPSSSLARNAGSFVRQLSPQPASAEDSESNR